MANADEFTDSLASKVVCGDRRALSRAITLVESTKTDHRAEAAQLLDELLPHVGGSIRIGITGAPGVGKSTFVERMGVELVELGRRVAVLAIDPSSTRSGGAILGDKTRMSQLAQSPGAYIRPSPSGGALGGVARRTREAMLVCEAAGYDVVLIETVGVGQSEIEVDDIVDVFVLLVSPEGGDELQAMKRGVMEAADIVVVTKADGDLAARARHAAADYGNALRLLRRKQPEWDRQVLVCSAVSGEGVIGVWDTIVRHHEVLARPGVLDRRRAEQARSWLWREITESLLREFRDDPGVARLAAHIEDQVAAGLLSAGSGAVQLLAAHRGA